MTTTRAIYLDHHASTPCDARVIASMLPYFADQCGNPSELGHSYGRDAAEAVELARTRVGELIGARASEIVFTSGATESNNLALKGLVRAQGDAKHIVVSAVEHASIRGIVEWLQRTGVHVTELPVDAVGRVDATQLAAVLRDDTLLVSVMLCNNELGTVQPIRELAGVCRARNVLLHCDASQGLGYVTSDVEHLGVDLMSLSAHKLYGPKGVGALYVRSQLRRGRIAPLADGGGQERGLRPGTLNVPGIVGFGVAAEILATVGASEAVRLGAVRNALWMELSASTGALLNGPPLTGGLRHPGNLHVSFPGADSEALLLLLKDSVALSTGSACTSSSIKMSHVLEAIGATPESARGAVRIGVGRATSAQDAADAAKALSQAVNNLRELTRRPRVATQRPS